MKTTDDKFVQAILVEENGFLFVRYVDENGDMLMRMEIKPILMWT